MVDDNATIKVQVSALNQNQFKLQKFIQMKWDNKLPHSLVWNLININHKQNYLAGDLVADYSRQSDLKMEKF